MKYFEIEEPYYALIRAESEEEAKEIYNEIVAEEDEFNLAVFTEITEEEAFKKFSNPKVWKGDNVSSWQIKTTFLNVLSEGATILLVDGDLI